LTFETEGLDLEVMRREVNLTACEVDLKGREVENDDRSFRKGRV
jgi:hypothetical protein